MTPIDRLLAKLPDVKKSGKCWSARCPAHEDRRASLSVAEGDDGRALVKCHAGCSTEAVCAALGLTLRELMPDDGPVLGQNGKPKGGGKTFVTANAAVQFLEGKYGPRSAIWTYHDAAGVPVGLTVRWDTPDGKVIRPVSRHGDGWRVAAMPEPRPLYGLSELRDATLVVFCEGEKAADAARSLGYVATTSAGGAEAAGKTDWSPLAAKEVWGLPDNDPPGVRYTGAAAGILTALTPPAVVKVVELPGLPPAGDLVDWIDAHGDAAEPGGMRAEIQALAAATEPFVRPRATAADGEPWPDPVPLTAGFDPPPFPVDVLTPWMREYVVALAEEKQVPVDLPAVLVLGAASAGIARKVTVTPWPGWHREPTNLFVIGALPPGERKSQTFAAVFAPVMALEAKLRECAEPVVNEAESAFRVAHKRVEHLEGKIAKNDDPQGRAKLAAELKVAREELRAVDVPAMPLLRVDDDTPEMLALELVKQHGRMLAASPEARTLENIDLYSDGPKLDVFLKGHAGDDLRSGRVSRGRDSVERPALTCVYTPQPCVLQTMGESPEMRGRGFLARWFYALPRSVVGYRKVRGAAVPGGVKAAYESAVTSLWRAGYRDEATEAPHDFTLTPEAEAEFRRFEAWKETQLRPGGELSDCCGWGNKLGGLCVRLCGVLHAADRIASGAHWATVPIPMGVVRRAVRLCAEYAVPNARAAFDLMGTTEVVVGARAVLKWLASRPDPTADFSKRDSFNGCRGTFRTVDDLQPALELLERHYLIRPRSDGQTRPGPGRPPSPAYEVHPAAFKGRPAAHNAQNTHNSGSPDSESHSAENAYSASGRPDPCDSPPAGSESPEDGAGHIEPTLDRLFPDLPSGLPD